MKFFNNNYKPVRWIRGFTLTELLIAIGIMVLILTVVLVNYRKFDGEVVLTNLAYDIGLSVRKAQSYGISVRGRTSGGVTTYTLPYGVVFNEASPQQYAIFIDLDGDGIYDGASEDVESFRMRGSFRIADICIKESAGPDCDSTTRTDITFVRPNPDALIRVDTDAALLNKPVMIKLESSRDPGEFRTITVSPTGQISIE
jgi:prepilin-type N-terminal cleavage/methylation domain-containing protein